MTNIYRTPNLLRIDGSLTLSAHFGELLRVRPIRTPGADPYDHARIDFRGLHIELIQRDAVRLSAELFEAARRIRPFPDLSGIATNIEDHQ